MSRSTQSSQDFVPEKVQETVFNTLLQRPENHQCADCLNKSPTWASIEFGVLLCLGCSGIHRQLGPHITRVKSSKLDKWKRDQVEIMASVGNKLANDYYEFKLPKGFRRLDSTASPDEFARFVRDKYIKKAFAPPGYPTPVAEFLTNKEKGLVVDLNFTKPNTTHKEVPSIVRKKSLTLEQQASNETTKKQVPNQQAPVRTNNQAPAQSKPIDFLNDFDTMPTSQNTQSSTQAEPSKPSSAFDFDFSAIQGPQSQNQAQQQPQSQVQSQTQGQNQQQFQNMPQQSQPEKNATLDITKLYQQSNNTYNNNQYGMNPMMNNGFNPYGNMQMNPNMQMNSNMQMNPNGFYQNNMNNMYPQNNQGWNQNGGGMGMNMNMNNNYQQFPNNGMQQQMYQNNFNQNANQGFMQNNMYPQQQQQQQQQYNNFSMQNNGLSQGMNYSSPPKFH